MFTGLKVKIQFISIQKVVILFGYDTEFSMEARLNGPTVFVNKFGNYSSISNFIFITGVLKADFRCGRHL